MAICQATQYLWRQNITFNKSFSAVVSTVAIRTFSQHFHFTWNKLDGYEIKVPLLNVNMQFAKWQVLWVNAVNPHNNKQNKKNPMKPKWQFISSNKYEFLNNISTLHSRMQLQKSTQLNNCSYCTYSAERKRKGESVIWACTTTVLFLDCVGCWVIDWHRR